MPRSRLGRWCELQANLFDTRDRTRDRKLMATVDQLNRQFGADGSLCGGGA